MASLRMLNALQHDEVLQGRTSLAMVGHGFKSASYETLRDVLRETLVRLRTKTGEEILDVSDEELIAVVGYALKNGPMEGALAGDET